jgi:DNA polymerase
MISSSEPASGHRGLNAVRAELGDCVRCALAETRTTIVFGAGDPAARVVLIGEAPGRSEDLKGEPFVGAAGRLLETLLESAGLTRDNVYIANVLKCRPPGNRDPRQAEIDACAPFLIAQLAAIRPQVVVTLGNFATRFVLRTDEPITRMRGTLCTAAGVSVFPVYHPAAAIYDPTKRDVLVRDFELLRELLDGGARP